MGNGKGEYEERGCGAEHEGILSIQEKGCRLGIVPTFSMAPGWMNELHKDAAKSTACSPFVFTESYQW
jgi:hypothetical protein